MTTHWKQWGMVAALLCSSGSLWAALPAPHEEPAGDNRHERELWATGKDVECKALPAAESTKLGIIRQMLNAGKPHAAIAYLDAARIAAPQADLLRADGLRQTGRAAEADRLYRQLLGSCVAGYAYQGLGLDASKLGKLQEAVTQLRAASAALPVEAAIRNDYGYALMSTGDNQAALHEFLTAIELAPGLQRAAHNLILLLSRSGEHEKAKTFADQFGISADQLADLQRLAQQPLPNVAEQEKTVAVVAVPGAGQQEMEMKP